MPVIPEKAKGRAKEPSLRELEFLPDPDAIEQRPLGGVTRGVLVLLSTLIAVTLTWAGFSKLDEIVVAPGRLVSSKPKLVVQPLDTSLVESIDVRVGQIVKAGQQLAALDPTFTEADQAYLKGGVSKLDAQEKRLLSELGSTVGSSADASSANAKRSDEDKLQSDLRRARVDSFRAKINALSENIAKLEASLSTNRADQQLIQERLKSLVEIEEMQTKLLQQNFGAKRQLLEATERRQAVDRELVQARNREKEILKEIQVSRAEKESFQSDWKQKTIEDLVDTRREKDGISEQLLKAQKRRSLIILRAPVDAVVLEIPKRSVGSVVREAEPLFTLVPLNAPLEVELQIASPDVGFVKLGDSVRIKLDAFPFQKFGTLTGKVTMVSEDAFVRDPSAIQSARQLSGNYYLARVLLESTKLEKHAEDISLRPGFTLSGEVKIGERTVMSYFLYPLIGTLDASLKERR